MSQPHVPSGPTAEDWADAKLSVTKIETSNRMAIYELRKVLVINGVTHIQFVWVNQLQLRSVGIDFGL